MTEEEKLSKAIQECNGGRLSVDEIQTMFLSSIAHSLAVIADKLIEDKHISGKGEGEE